MDALNNAREITATKSLISWGDEWVIEADGQQVGTVTGQAIYTIGDVYSLTTTSGNLVASETEELNAITHTPPSTTGTISRTAPSKNASSRSPPP